MMEAIAFAWRFERRASERVRGERSSSEVQVKWEVTLGDRLGWESCGS